VQFWEWGDPKRFIFEDLLVYGSMLVIFIWFDPIINLLRASGIIVFDHEVYHPLNYGKGQIIGILFSSLQLIRKCVDWRYHNTNEII